MDQKAVHYEVNFLTTEKKARSEIIRAIEAEFDFVRMCQGMIKPFGFQAKQSLDRFIALSLRKLLCDESSMLKTVCPDFKMPPLSGKLFECPGEQNEMQLCEIQPDIRVKPQREWIYLDVWLNERIAWINKGAKDIPNMYDDHFYKILNAGIGNNTLERYFISEVSNENGKKKVWRLKDPSYKPMVYEILKNKGYYDLSIKRLIKHIADKKGAHLDALDSMWINMANTGMDLSHNVVSIFAIHMIYAATQQIEELKTYMDINPMLEM